MERNKDLKLVFVTLTVPDGSTSLTANQLHKECLEPFLRYMRRTQKLKSYIWKLEQQKRGALHYHLTINCYISHLQIRKCWNMLLKKAGLMTSYEQNFGNSNPNSTDVKAVYKCKNIAAYLSKYLSKTEQNENAVKGKVWDCSLNLKSAKRFTILADSEFCTRLYEKVEKGVLKEVVGDRFRIICGTPSQVISSLSLQQIRDYDKWRFGISSYKRSIKLQKKTTSIVPVVVSPEVCIMKQLVLSLKSTDARYLYN